MLIALRKHPVNVLHPSILLPKQPLIPLSRNLSSSCSRRKMASSTKALITRRDQADDKAIQVLETVPLPAPGPSQLLTKILTAAQNPTDIKSLDMARFPAGAMLGCDICGVVEQAGSKVTRFRLGDRIASLLMQGRSNQPGAYAEHTITEENLSFPVPASISSEAAATVPLACNTAWLALLGPHSLGIDRSRGAEPVQLLIWGGTSSVGQYAIQIARMLGFNFATTCRNRSVVEALGAEHVFDYTSATVVEDIKKALPRITYVLDCIGSVESSQLASQAVAEGGGKLCTIQPGKRNTEKVVPGVEVSDVMVFTAFGEELNYGKVTLGVREEDRDLSRELYEKLPEWLEKGIIKPNQPKVVEGGLAGVEKGFDLYRNGKISGEKIVYKIGQE